MSEKLNPNRRGASGAWVEVKPYGESERQPDLKDPRVVLSLLEADQVVAAKTRTRFGQRSFSFGLRLLLWGLRVYVLVMLFLVLVSILHAVHAVH
jgi:hypothetical protein